jgi:hypothetical protein
MRHTISNKLLMRETTALTTEEQALQTIFQALIMEANT